MMKLITHTALRRITRQFYATLLVLVVSMTAQANEVAFLAHTDGYWQVWKMHADGSEQMQVTRSPYDKHRVSWYPDGEHLLVNGLQGELVKVQIATAREAPLELPLSGSNDAVLSTDGQRIAFSLSTADSRDDHNIWVINSDGSDQRKLTNLSWLQHQPSWSPDGSSLYFASGDGQQNHDLWHLKFEPHKLEQLTTAQLYNFDAVVSVSGQLAFSSNRSGNYEIWVQQPNQKAKRITKALTLDAHPSWSPDGTNIIFESTRETNVPNLWRVDLDGGQPERLTEFRQGARSPVWRMPVKVKP